MIFETIKPTDLRAQCSPFNLFILLKKKSFLPELAVAIQQFLREIPIYQKTHQKMDVPLAGKKIRKYSNSILFGIPGTGIY